MERQLDKLEQLVHLQQQANSLLEEVIKIFHLSKPVLTLYEAARYMGISSSTLHHYTAAGLITHYKPNNKNIYFNKEELEAFMLQGKVEGKEKIEENGLRRFNN